ncbi:MAG: helix-turn-helix domain-containing protein [Limnobacter sp.]|nr:helix-turn-helix domain-containing protein [Limnobacter sp.]
MNTHELTRPAVQQPPTLAAGIRLRELRARQKISQLELAFRVGVSQRHLSCIETGKAAASRDMLVAILDGLEAPLKERNDTLVAAGFAPQFGQRPLNHAEMQSINQVIDMMLTAHNPCPAFVMDSVWNLVRFNEGVMRLFTVLEVDPSPLIANPNMLEAMLLPGNGILDCMINADEVRREVYGRAERDSSFVPELRPILQRIEKPESLHPRTHHEPAKNEPVLVTRFRSRHGELKFMSTFTTFGTPMDITVASLRIEHLFPADEHTRKTMENACKPS